MRRTRSTILVLLAASVGLSGCDSGGSADPATIAPASSLPTDASTTASSSTSSSTTEPSTTVVDTTTLAGSLPGGEIGLSPDGPWRLVDSAPGITTPGLVYELMPKLWVYLPLEEDIEQGILWTLTEEDLPIIEAYLQARLTRYRATMHVPADLQDAGWRLYYTDSLLDALLPAYEEWSDQNIYTDLDQGVVLRPQVLGEGRSEDNAIIVDCTLDGAVLREADGTYTDGATPGVAEHGRYAVMVLAEGAWKIDESGEQEGLCG